MRIGIYTFAYDEASNVEAWVRSAQDADTITFCDTGSTDGTGSFAAAWAADLRIEDKFKLHQISIKPWRFDHAHNAALALVPADADICIPLHLDERLTPGWRGPFEEAWHRRAKIGLRPLTKVFYDYQFSPALTFRQNRIHARHGYAWRYPAHEGVYPAPGVQEVSEYLPGFKITQVQDTSKDRMSRDLELLAMGVAEYPLSARMAFYYGRQLMYAKRYAEAIPHLRRYFDLPDAWNGEAAQCADALATCYKALP